MDDADLRSEFDGSENEDPRRLQDLIIHEPEEVVRRLGVDDDTAVRLSNMHLQDEDSISFALREYGRYDEPRIESVLDSVRYYRQRAGLTLSLEPDDVDEQLADIPESERNLLVGVDLADHSQLQRMQDSGLIAAETVRTVRSFIRNRVWSDQEDLEQREEQPEEAETSAPSTPDRIREAATKARQGFDRARHGAGRLVERAGETLGTWNVSLDQFTNELSDSLHEWWQSEDKISPETREAIRRAFETARQRGTIVIESVRQRAGEAGEDIEDWSRRQSVRFQTWMASEKISPETKAAIRQAIENARQRGILVLADIQEKGSDFNEWSREQGLKFESWRSDPETRRKLERLGQSAKKEFREFLRTLTPKDRHEVIALIARGLADVDPLTGIVLATGNVISMGAKERQTYKRLAGTSTDLRENMRNYFAQTTLGKMFVEDSPTNLTRKSRVVAGAVGVSAALVGSLTSKAVSELVRIPFVKGAAQTAVSRTFYQYLSPRVIDFIAQEAAGKLKLGGLESDDKRREWVETAIRATALTNKVLATYAVGKIAAKEIGEMDLSKLVPKSAEQTGPAVKTPESPGEYGKETVFPDGSKVLRDSEGAVVGAVLADGKFLNINTDTISGKAQLELLKMHADWSPLQVAKAEYRAEHDHIDVKDHSKLADLPKPEVPVIMGDPVHPVESQGGTYWFDKNDNVVAVHSEKYGWLQFDPNAAKGGEAYNQYHLANDHKGDLAHYSVDKLVTDSQKPYSGNPETPGPITTEIPGQHPISGGGSETTPTEAFNQAKEGVQEAVDKVTEKAPGVYAEVRDSFEKSGAMEGLSQARDTVVEVYHSVVDSLGDTFHKVGDSLEQVKNIFIPHKTETNAEPQTTPVAPGEPIRGHGFDTDHNGKDDSWWLQDPKTHKDVSGELPDGKHLILNQEGGTEGILQGALHSANPDLSPQQDATIANRIVNNFKFDSAEAAAHFTDNPNVLIAINSDIARFSFEDFLIDRFHLDYNTAHHLAWTSDIASSRSDQLVKGAPDSGLLDNLNVQININGKIINWNSADVSTLETWLKEQGALQ